MKIIVLFILLFGFLCFGNQTFRERSVNKKPEINNNNILAEIPRKSEQINKIIEDFNGIILNSQLSDKFDSTQNKFKEFDLRISCYDSLMLLRNGDRDTLIRTGDVKFLESLDPNTAYYLHGNDTVIGGNGFCSSEYYLLKNGILSKIINQYADCVESSSSITKVLLFDSNGKRWFYLKDIEDVWDETKYKIGYEGIVTEIFACFNSNNIQFAIQKKFINCRSDMNICDTLKYELIDYDDFSFLIPDIVNYQE